MILLHFDIDLFECTDTCCSVGTQICEKVYVLSQNHSTGKACVYKKQLQLDIRFLMATHNVSGIGPDLIGTSSFMFVCVSACSLTSSPAYVEDTTCCTGFLSIFGEEYKTGIVFRWNTFDIGRFQTPDSKFSLSRCRELAVDRMYRGNFSSSSLQGFEFALRLVSLWIWGAYLLLYLNTYIIAIIQSYFFRKCNMSMKTYRTITGTIIRINWAIPYMFSSNQSVSLTSRFVHFHHMVPQSKASSNVFGREKTGMTEINEETQGV